MGKASTSDLRPWQVERRRYQNASAQRRRRQKQKEALARNRRLPLQTVTRKASSLSDELISAIFDCFTTDTERSNVALIMANENFGLRDIVKYGPITLGYAADPEILRITEDLAFYSWSLLVLSAALSDIHLKSHTSRSQDLLDLEGPKTWSGELSLMALAKEDGYILTNCLGSTGNPTITI